MSKWISRIVTVLAVLALLYKGSDWLVRRSGSIPVVPDPNAYTTLLSLAESTPDFDRDLADLTQSEVRRIAEEQRRTLEAVHAALTIESGVPLGVGHAWAETHEREIQRLKRIAALLGLQSRAHLLEGQTNRAIDAVVDIVALGHLMGRGGNRTDVLHGLTVETIGVTLLRGLFASADATAARRAAQALENLENRRQTIEQTREIDRAWKTASFGVVGQVGDMLLRRANAKRNADFQERHQKVVARSRRALLALAARTMEQETGQAPTSPNQLVPTVLRAVPTDPATGAAFDRLPPNGE